MFQAQLSTLWFDPTLFSFCSIEAHAAANFLEVECFRKHGRSGRPFYNSQVATTVRWLATCSLEEFSSRTKEATSTGLKSNSICADVKTAPVVQLERSAVTASTSGALELHGTDATTLRSVPQQSGDETTVKPNAAAILPKLPDIPSFGKYLSNKRESTSSIQDQLPPRPRKKFKPPLLVKK